MEKVVYSSGCIDLYKKNVHQCSFYIDQNNDIYPISILKGIVDTFPNIQKDTKYNNILFPGRGVTLFGTGNIYYGSDKRYYGTPVYYSIEIDTPGLKEALQDLLYFRENAGTISNKRTSDDIAP